MKKDNKILDDLAKLAGSTFTSAVNVKNEIAEYITQQIEKLIKKMNFVTREEFDVVKKLAQDNRLMLEKMKDKKTRGKKNEKERSSN
ncbi:accessory factor UbiK family protein [Candidatus Bandiella numerosa]|uniref:accessory factor UbiK family protein n=1 Tax=Candidatus Bandiella numerosa TaxID=2570586 RepID=UPI001F370FF5|nr:accessory factor UbiK family protein [Candidatus Bandiella numerosa]